MRPVYDLNKINPSTSLRVDAEQAKRVESIKFATDEATFQRAVDLYESAKVTKVEEKFGAFTALVLGTKPYRVSISAQRYKDGSCACYLGQQGNLCKHRVALALYAVLDGKPLTAEDKQQTFEVTCSGRREALNNDELTAINKSITESMKYIKPYSGPSRTWFANQDSLQEGCNRLTAIVSTLPVDRQTADMLVKLLLRLDRKLQVGGVDDSNGIVGGFMNDVVAMLKDFTHMDPACIDAFELLYGKQTCFGWEEPLIRILDESSAV